MNRCLPMAVILCGVLLAGCSAKQPGAAPPATETAPIAAASESPASSAPADAIVTDSAEPTAVAVSDDAFSLDDYDDDSSSVQVSDPLEPWNRFWFRFNDVLLLNVLKPVHTGYAKVVPAPVRGGISNFAHNLVSPIRFLNSLLQGKFTQAGVEFGRFCINTMTSLGLADVASQSKPLYPYHPETENFGHTLAVWGVPEGPFLIWPFFGPTTARGTVGLIGDGFAAPQNYIISWRFTATSAVGFTFNDLDKVYKPYEQVSKASLEPYIAIRNGYLTMLRNIPR